MAAERGPRVRPAGYYARISAICWTVLATAQVALLVWGVLDDDGDGRGWLWFRVLLTLVWVVLAVLTWRQYRREVVRGRGPEG